MNVLVLNCGSSSLKFQLIAIAETSGSAMPPSKLAKGVVERIGGQAIVTLEGSTPRQTNTTPLRDHRAAIDFITRWLFSDESGLPEISDPSNIDAVGHRVVHGGERFTKSVLISDSVIRDIEDCIDLAPLHNPANLSGIRAAIATFGPTVPQVAVFDTAFHQSLPDHAYLYAIPYAWYRRYRIRRYGFHGSSHRFVSSRYYELTGSRPEETNVISAHLGNGCSVAAISHGKSVDTSMGMTPLEGLVMGTRSGDLDPAILDFVGSREGLSSSQVESLLNKQSGLLGISGLTNDLRDLLAEEHENSDRRAHLALEIFCYRIRKYIGAYLAAMGGADAIIFTGGVGENSAEIRQRVLTGLEWMGIHLDMGSNSEMVRGKEGSFSSSGSRVKLMVIPTDEELMIAKDTISVLKEPETSK